jgi:hypothetical protein
MRATDRKKVSNKAKCEIEIFINCHLDDPAKGWPTIHTTQAGKPNGVEGCGLRLERCLNMSDRKETIS